ncbi:MAG: VOC family protein [Pseudomonadota bacterium]|nr:VOC family protein [Pseudomonadota bacterium]
MPTAASSPATPSPAIFAAEPQLLVNDLAVSLDFYTTKLGFQVAFSYGEPPSYAQVARGGGRLNLRRACGPIYSEGFREREPDVLAATLTLEDANGDGHLVAGGVVGADHRDGGAIFDNVEDVHGQGGHGCPLEGARGCAAGHPAEGRGKAPGARRSSAEGRVQIRATSLRWASLSPSM